MHGYTAKPSQQLWSWSDEDFKKYCGDISFERLAGIRETPPHLVVASWVVDGVKRTFCDWWGNPPHPGRFYADREKTANGMHWAINYERLHPGVRFKDHVLLDSIRQAAQEYDSSGVMVECPTWWARRHPDLVVNPKIGEVKFSTASEEVQAELISLSLNEEVSLRSWQRARKGREPQSVEQAAEWVLEECPLIRTKWKDKQVARI